MSKNKAHVAVSKRSMIVGVVLGVAVTALLVVLFKPSIETTITGKTDLGAISENRLKELEKKAISEEADADAAAVPTGPGYAQPLPASALRVPKENR